MTEEDAAARQAAGSNESAAAGPDETAPEGENGAEHEPGPGGSEADEIETLRRQAEDNRNQYLRAVAELDNLRKRNAREIENARKFGVERFLSAILPVRDSLEAGLKAAQEADPGTVEIGSLLEGEQATLRLLDQALEAAGVTEIDPEGEPFDPERHEAMSMLPSPTAEPGSVLTVVQKGYALHERIVRPARVIVARAPTEPEAG